VGSKPRLVLSSGSVFIGGTEKSNFLKKFTMAGAKRVENRQRVSSVIDDLLMMWHKELAKSWAKGMRMEMAQGLYAAFCRNLSDAARSTRSLSWLHFPDPAFPLHMLSAQREFSAALSFTTFFVLILRMG